ncbi:MAG: hypothetical protein KDC49_16810 [Saprospiraceae bacterium]|nr:hypothetical protein [Saprospiraceae bacterium]
MTFRFYLSILLVSLIFSCTEENVTENTDTLKSDFIKELLPKELFINDSKVIYKDDKGNSKIFNIDFFEKNESNEETPFLRLASVMQNEDYYFNLIIDVSKNYEGNDSYFLIYDLIDHKNKMLVNQMLTIIDSRSISATRLNGKKIEYKGEVLDVYEGNPADGDFGCKEMFFSIHHGIVQFTDRDNVSWVLVGYQ